MRFDILAWTCRVEGCVFLHVVGQGSYYLYGFRA